MRRSEVFRVPAVLLVLGLLGVVAGLVGTLVMLHPPLTDGSGLTQFIAPSLAYCLVGVGWWQWIPASDATDATRTAMRRASRVLAAASGTVALGYLAAFYGSLRWRYVVGNSNFYLPHFRLEVASQLSSGVGFCLAAVGFWIASNAFKKKLPDSSHSHDLILEDSTPV